MRDMQPNVYRTLEEERDARIARAIAAIQAAEPIEDRQRIGENLASIVEIPAAALPDCPARTCIMELALAGFPVSAYQGTSLWNLWIGSERIECSEWLAWMAKR